jgi:hypothetical protein
MENVNGEGMSVEPNWRIIFRVRHRLSQDMWLFILENVKKTQLCRLKEECRRLVREKVEDRGALHRALDDLVQLKLIRRRYEKSWDEVWVNPEAVHPYGLKGNALTDAIASFYAGTMTDDPGPMMRREP